MLLLPTHSHTVPFVAARYLRCIDVSIPDASAELPI